MPTAAEQFTQVLSALSNIALGRNAAASDDPPQHNVAPAKPGHWLDGTATVHRSEERLAFA
jgi:hypothetical protein